VASPQKENGYTTIANELFEALARTRISGEARQVLDVIFRKTYGFNKKKDFVALSQFCECTGLTKQSASRALKKLIEMGIVDKKDKGSPVAGNAYEIIKDYEKWKPLSKKITVDKKDKAVDKKDKESRQKSGIQKKERNYTKDIGAEAQKKKKKFNPLGAEILKGFEGVDSKNKTYYKNTTQREACDFLLSEYGLERVLKAVKLLPKINEQNLYIAQITTPYELKLNWVKLGNAVRKKAAEQQEKLAKVIW
jgi:phage replication O-like protein O